MTSLYRQIADHYREAIASGALREGERLPSVRQLMVDHRVSLATALQACRHLEDQGWAEARPRSGYFVQRPRRLRLPPAAEHTVDHTADHTAEAATDAADYGGIHERVSDVLARGQRATVHTNLALAVGSPELYPGPALQRLMQRQLRLQPALLTTMSRRHGHPDLRRALVQRALARGVAAAPDEVVVTHGCVEALNLALRAVTRPGDTVAVESPTFYGVLQVLESLSLRVLELPTSPATGLSLDALALALGLRLGWMLCGRWQPRVEMLKYTQSRYGEELPQAVAAAFIGSPAYVRHLRQFRQALTQQREYMAEAVAAHFPPGTRCNLPEGGLLLWLQLPAGVSSDRVFDEALAHGIKVAPGMMFSNSRRFDDCLRLSCGLRHGPALDEALRRVGGIVAQLAR